MDQMANLATGKQRTGLMHGPWEGFQCMGTKDTTKSTGKRPRAHSEIAALEDMIEIPANADMDQWVTQILTFYDPATRGFPTLCGNERSHGRLHAQILNSQHPPCGVVVDGQERTFRGYEMPCLEELVSRVRKAIGPFFVIHVVSPVIRETEGKRELTGEVNVVRYGKSTTIAKFPDVESVMGYRHGHLFGGAHKPTNNNWNGTYWYWD